MDGFERPPADKQQAIMGEYFALRGMPGVLTGEQLQPAETATTVRVEHGETLTTDGPFATRRSSSAASS